MRIVLPLALLSVLTLTVSCRQPTAAELSDPRKTLVLDALKKIRANDQQGFLRTLHPVRLNLLHHEDLRDIYLEMSDEKKFNDLRDYVNELPTDDWKLEYRAKGEASVLLLSVKNHQDEHFKPVLNFFLMKIELSTGAREVIWEILPVIE